MGRRKATLQSTLARVIEDDHQCWLWLGALSDGYGVSTALRPGGSRLVHRIVYESIWGILSDGVQLDHLCRVRHCCNPAHMEPVTQKINILRGEGACAQNARKTHCKRNHEFTPENTGQHKGGGRYCIQCSRDAAKRQRARNHKGKRMDTVNAPKQATL